MNNLLLNMQQSGSAPGVSDVHRIAGLGSALGVNGLQNLEMVVTNDKGETSVVKGGLFDLQNLADATPKKHHHSSGVSDIHRL